jgi:hypothetical protein
MRKPPQPPQLDDSPSQHSISHRRPWRSPKVILSEIESTRGGFVNPAETHEIHFTSISSQSNQPS